MKPFFYAINHVARTCNPCGNTVEECECKDREVRVVCALPPDRHIIEDLEPLDIELDTRNIY